MTVVYLVCLDRTDYHEQDPNIPALYLQRNERSCELHIKLSQVIARYLKLNSF